MLSKPWKVKFAGVLLVGLMATPLTALAEEKPILIAFDRNKLCCIMNHLKLEEMLTDVDGINKAVFHQRKREISIVYESSKITVPQIVDRLVDITKVDRDIILLPDPK